MDVRMTATEVMARRERRPAILRGLHQHPLATTKLAAGTSCAYKPHIQPMGCSSWRCSGVGQVGVGPSAARAYTDWLRAIKLDWVF